MDLPALVACERRALRLTESACARFWASSNPVPPPVWEGRVACHQCPAGAARNGVAIDPFQAVHDRLRPICPRCRRTSERIIADSLCVSCYNRDAEVRRGYNGKGSLPVDTLKRLGRARIVKLENGVPTPVEKTLACGAFELVLHAARRAAAPLSFGWAPTKESLAA